MITNKSILFHEEQTSRRAVIILALLFGLLLPIGVFVLMMMEKKMNSFEFLLSILAILVIEIPLFLLLYYTKFETIVLNEGLGYRWWPLQKKYRMIFTNDILDIRTRKGPSANIGVHWVFGYGWVHNVKGRTGFQLKLRSGKKLYIGSQQIDELRSALEKLLNKRIGEFRNEF